MAVMKVLTVESLTARRQDTNEELRDVSLSLESGEIVAMLGSGAPLLFDLAARERWLRPQSGWIRYADEQEDGSPPAAVQQGRARPKYLLPDDVVVVGSRGWVQVFVAASASQYVAEAMHARGMVGDYDDIESIVRDAKCEALLDVDLDALSMSDLPLLHLWACIASGPAVLLVRDPYPPVMLDAEYRARYHRLLGVAASRGAGVLLLSATEHLDTLTTEHAARRLLFAAGTYMVAPGVPAR